jgi:hypothetical protein
MCVIIRPPAAERERAAAARFLRKHRPFGPFSAWLAAGGLFLRADFTAAVRLPIDGFPQTRVQGLHLISTDVEFTRWSFRWTPTEFSNFRTGFRGQLPGECVLFWGFLSRW